MIIFEWQEYEWSLLFFYTFHIFYIEQDLELQKKKKKTLKNSQIQVLLSNLPGFLRKFTSGNQTQEYILNYHRNFKHRQN